MQLGARGLLPINRLDDAVQPTLTIHSNIGNSHLGEREVAETGAITDEKIRRHKICVASHEIALSR